MSTRLRQRDREICYPAGMAGKAWTPKNDEQRELRARYIAAFAKIDQATEEAWAIAAEAAAAGIPKTSIADDTGVSAATMNRHLGRTKHGIKPVTDGRQGP